MFADRVLQRLIETRPAGAAFEFGFRGEQRQVAAGACEDALAMFLQERARPWTLGAFIAHDFVLLRSKLGTPFRLGLFDLELACPCGCALEPAQGRKAKQTSGRGEQDAAVDHEGLRSKLLSGCSPSNTGR